MRHGSPCTALLLCLNGLACASVPSLAAQTVGPQPHGEAAAAAPPAPAEASVPGMRLAKSTGASCFVDREGGLVCPTRGAPLRSMPALLYPDAPQDLALRQPGALPPHPACYSGSQSVPCDESFNLPQGASFASDD